ncbi:MAG: metalloregulator ArsR/SmtB family transcription factor [Thermoproteota archaeon]|jgi:Predicted transcriptional regulators
MTFESENYYKLFIKAFGSPVRLKILNLLRKSPKSVMEISKELNLDQSLVSHNLKCLLDCGFVFNKREGRRIIYSVNESIVNPLFELIDNHIQKYKEHLISCNILIDEEKTSNQNSQSLKS